MANKQFKTHCRIIDYIESTDADLAQVIRGVCADGSLGSTKGRPGTTFLMPQDKAFIKKISDLAFSSDVDDADKANDMINALIIRDVFKTPGEWMAHKDDIPNALYPSQHVEVESATATEIIFKSGARATLDKNFKDASRRKNLAVWKLTGEIPVTKDKNATNKYTRQAKGKTGGYAASTVESQNLRFQICKQVEQEFAAAAMQKKGAWINYGRAAVGVYHVYTQSLINWMLNNGHGELVRDRVIPIISLDVVDFYFLVEPHKTGTNMLLSDAIIKGWWDNKNSAEKQKYVFNHVGMLQNKTSANGALVYANRAKIVAEINLARKKVTGIIESKPRAGPEMIEKIYKELEANNSIGAASPIYPADLAAFYNQEAGLKLVQDELRYLSFAIFQKLDSNFDLGLFHEVTNMIGECLHAGNPDDRSRCLRLLNTKTIKYLIAPTEKIQEIHMFVECGMFLYIPLTIAEIEASGVKRPTVGNIVVPDMRDWLYKMYTNDINDGAFTGASEHSFIESLKALDVDDLSPEDLAALKQKLGCA